MLPNPPASAEYEIRDEIHQGADTTVYRALRASDHSSVILKVLDPRRCQPNALERLRHEYEIGASLETPTIVRSIALETYRDMPVLVLEDWGHSLEQLLGERMPVERFLELAIRITAAVAELHRQGVVHKDLKPRNILVDAGQTQVKLADFSIATRIPREQQSPRPPQLIEGTLPYMSPEQTGRMNRVLDSRSDLYSLGITFYRMLTGRLPFEARDPLEWLHCHVARRPLPPSRLVPDVPEVLDRIVLKLLAKTAEDRYQTARGLEHDLARCRESWRRCGWIDPFTLGERDVPDRLQIPQKLFGREAQVSMLLSAFERVANTGDPELVLVSGYSGIGKSSVVRELEKPILARRGLFAKGKFDQCRRDIPYSTIAQAFRGLVLDLLVEGEERVAAWRERLRGSLGMNARLVADVIPELDLLIGEQPLVPELPLREAKVRFHMVFRQFLGAFAREDHPLALFLDDLQWADAASLELLADVLTHPETRHLHAIGAYRDNEVGPAHPLMKALDGVRAGGLAVHEVVLAPLSREYLRRFVAEAMRRSDDEAEPLALLLEEKTAGNPYFAIQFLTSLEQDGLLRFEPVDLAWRCDIAAARARDYTGNVVDLMVGKLRHLPTETQKALELAACVGAHVEAETLTSVFLRDPEPALRPALEEGLLVRLDRTYLFPHDRVQEAAYSLVPEDERAAVHLGIGRLLLARTAPDHVEDEIFEIVNQLDRGAALITSREERERVAELNLIAGKRAKGSAAYASALKYLAAGSALLGEDVWDRRYDLAFALEFHRAECEVLTGDLQAAEDQLAALARRARTHEDAASVTSAQCDLHTTRGQGDLAVKAFLEYMRRLGVSWSPHPTRDEVREEFKRMWRRLGSRRIESLVDLPPMTDRGSRATIELMTWAHPPAQFFDENLGALVIARMANLSLEHGNSDASGLAYAWLGSLLGSLFGDYRTGYRFGKVGLDLVEKRGLVRFQSRVYVIFGALVSPHSSHLREGIPLIRRAYDTALQACDVTYACYARNAFTTLCLAAGDPLAAVQLETEDARLFVEKAKFGMMVDIIESKLRLIRALRGLAPTSALEDERTRDACSERLLETDRSLAIGVCWHFVRKLQERYYAGDYRSAVDAAAKAEALLWTSPSFVEESEYHFYAALARAAHCDDAPTGERHRHAEALADHDKRLTQWAEHCPENFQDRHALVSAELARVEGRVLDAERLYDQAIRSARENGFIQNEALAYELASRFYRARGFERTADAHLREARARYLRWGADGKVRQLDRLHPELVERPPLAPSGTFAASPEELDLLSVVKASQTISGEIETEKLIGTLLRAVLEQGGARRGCLLLDRDGALFVEAEASVEDAGVVTRSVPSLMDSSGLVPVSVVNYTRATRQPVVLEDAAADAGKFAADEYFSGARTRSVLCLPILRQAKLVGLLYLENRHVAGAFTSDRLMTLSLLASQAAISVENARLLSEERKARERAAFLSEAGALLSESLDYGQTLTRLSRLCVESLADWCVLDLLEGREIRRLAGACADPVKEPLLELLRERHPARWGSAHPAVLCLRSGEPLLLPELSDDFHRSHADDEEHVELVRALGTRSAVVVPLVARGQTLGVFTMASATPGRFGRADLELAEQLAHRAALAIDNARLYRDAQKAIAVRDEFLSVASHELRTPLQALQLAVQVLERSARGPAAFPPRMAGIATRQIRRLNALVAQLLDVARLQGGTLAIAPEEFDLAAEVREFLERMQPLIQQSHCDLRLHAPEPIIGSWDRSRLEQLLTNLLANALTYGGDQPVDVTLEQEGAGGAGRVRITIRDRGPGIPGDRLPHIFERFERASSTRNYGGLGLGLFIAREIAQAHGGTISVDSALGCGSSFTVELPLWPPQGARELSAAETNIRDEGSPGHAAIRDA